MPEPIDLHTNEEYQENWVKYSCLDAESTFWLREVLIHHLENRKSFGQDNSINNMYELYLKYWRDFGKTLVEMERVGFKINTNVLNNAKSQSVYDLEELNNKMKEYVAYELGLDNSKYFNPTSVKQLQSFLYAPWSKSKLENKESITKLENDNIKHDESNYIDSTKINSNIDYVNRYVKFKLMNPEWIPNSKELNKDKSRMINFNIKGLNLPVFDLSLSGLPSVDATSLKKIQTQFI